MNKGYLLCNPDDDEYRLLTEAEALAYMLHAEEPHNGVMMGLGKAAAILERAAPDKTEWACDDLCKVTAMPFQTLDAWVRKGVIPCSIKQANGRGPANTRIFSRQDAFIAACLASLRRRTNMPLPQLKRVAELLQQEQQEQLTPA